ncbi:Na/Pi cotransporter family protein [Roseburia sp. 499]|uniref:Na/Pi cotransporter family protein n=1 Tax=Roseburia sp. 499 TaxID=1261634 RepID=UPI000951C507|nr:Na/Pi cotransporter family protein [Roseburia sp. 499]WVK69653.1 Na/Pi cotransporter family protein [Roseburia sp. 499]
MNIFGFLSLLGGLALFLYGMNVMGGGLEKVSGGKLERILERLTSNPLKAVLLGAGVTAVIQSSSATTVMLVGFVNSGIMKLSQAIGIIMGANIGTTATSWLLSLTGIESDNFFISMLKPTSFSPILAVIGVIMIMSKKSDRRKDVGEILIGFAVLMFGMETMSSAVKPLADVPEFTGILTKFSNPLLGVLAGAVLTAVIQSSSASVGILQALSVTGAFTYGSVIPIIMGQNIGTCVTAILSAVGANKGAKRTACVHLYFNIIGSVLFLALYMVLNAVFHFSFADETVGVAGIAAIHSIFNVFATLLLLPFTKGLEKLAYLTIPVDESELSRKGEEEEFKILDSRFLATPNFAIEQCVTVTKQMAELTRDTLVTAKNLFTEYSEEAAEKVEKQENLIDKYDDKLSAYLTQLNSQNLSYRDSQMVSTLMHSINDFERIADHAVNLMEIIRKMNKKEIEFSAKAQREMEIFGNAVEDILDRSVRAFVESDMELALTVEPLEEVIDDLNKEVKKRHIKRLRKGKCTIDLGLVLADVAANYERVADHCSNLAVYMIQMEDSSIEAHEYVNTLTEEIREQFEQMQETYREKYQLS